MFTWADRGVSMNETILSVRQTQYRTYEIHTRVTGTSNPFICGFTLVPLEIPNGEKIVRMCIGRYSSLEDAHAVAQLVGEKTVDVVLARLRRRDSSHSALDPA